MRWTSRTRSTPPICGNSRTPASATATATRGSPSWPMAPGWSSWPRVTTIPMVSAACSCSTRLRCTDQNHFHRRGYDGRAERPGKDRSPLSHHHEQHCRASLRWRFAGQRLAFRRQWNYRRGWIRRTVAGDADRSQWCASAHHSQADGVDSGRLSGRDRRHRPLPRSRSTSPTTDPEHICHQGQAGRRQLGESAHRQQLRATDAVRRHLPVRCAEHHLQSGTDRCRTVLPECRQLDCEQWMVLRLPDRRRTRRHRFDTRSRDTCVLPPSVRRCRRTLPSVAPAANSPPQERAFFTTWTTVRAVPSRIPRVSSARRFVPACRRGRRWSRRRTAPCRASSACQAAQAWAPTWAPHAKIPCRQT